MRSPTLYLDFLRVGHEGLQHLGYGTRDFNADLARLLAMGYNIGHAGSVRSRGRFVYVLTEGHPGTIVELCDMSQGRDHVFAGIAAAAHHWDGRDPIRTTLPTG